MTIYSLVPVYFPVYLLAATFIIMITLFAGFLLRGSYLRRSLFCIVSLTQIIVIPYLVLFIELFGSLTHIVREASQAEPNYLSAWRLFECHIREFLVAWIIGIVLGLIFRFFIERQITNQTYPN
jgi:hypothetical protein